MNEQIKNIIKKHTSSLKTSFRVLKFEVKLANQSMYHNEGYQKLTTIEQITNKIAQSDLIFFGSPCMEIKPEFLNRIRLNTIRGAQVFFPIPFSEYSPTITNAVPHEEIEINKNNGYFDSHSYEFFAFYNSDFQTSRNEFIFSRFQIAK